MLKCLELVGFKSFADKTQFEFSRGITAVVGPNGSGKSNIVDAVKWVLGEQSAKSLRGGEMADVIFNGSATRRSLGLAEVTMTFDNTRRDLATENEEVQITRRVYRTGEGEYLINGQVSRLKDIKDLFLGSGAGADAYSIIEQGRVDVLVQSSPKARRTIFEEAAGISRFKAKKVETQRKLERVDLNVQRLRDIIDEVEKQLRSVKLQAAKAQRYQEYSGRLRELRVGLGLQEYHQLTEQLGAETAVLDGLKAALEERAAQAAAWEADTQRLEAALARLDDGLREQEGLLAGARQQIKAEETTLGHEWALSTDLEAELQELTEADAQVQGRLGQARQTLADQRQERERLRQLCDETGDLVSTLRQQRSGLASRVEVLEGLERSHEGLGTGVREVLALLEQPDPGPWRTILGMIADFLTVQREYAPLIDLALGETAQRFLVRDAAQLHEALRERGR